MKVLYISHSADISGASIALYNIIKEVSKNASVAVLLPFHGKFSEQLERMNIECFYLDYEMCVYPKASSICAFLKFPFSLVVKMVKNRIACFKLEKLVRAYSPDIIHTNAGPLCIGYEIAKKCAIPHVWHIREYQNLDFGIHPFPSMNKFLNKLHDKNNFLIAITKGIYAHFDMSTNAVVVYDGVVDINNNQSEYILEKEKYFLFVGNLSEAKGLKELLIVFSLFCAKDKVFKLLIAGGGNGAYIKECQQIVEDAKLVDRISFLGFRADVYSLMSGARALIVPSRFEGFGFITVEAMLNKCLVIGKNTAGTKEQFDNGLELCGEEIGIRFDSFDNLPLILEKVADINVSYNGMIERANRTVMELYSIDSCINRIQLIYENVIK